MDKWHRGKPPHGTYLVWIHWRGDREDTGHMALADYSGQWSIIDNADIDVSRCYRFVAWMPLPEPPKSRAKQPPR